MELGSQPLTAECVLQ